VKKAFSFVLQASGSNQGGNCKKFFGTSFTLSNQTNQLASRLSIKYTHFGADKQVLHTAKHSFTKQKKPRQATAGTF